MHGETLNNNGGRTSDRAGERQYRLRKTVSEREAVEQESKMHHSEMCGKLGLGKFPHPV